MVNINLHQEIEKDQARKKKSWLSRSSNYISLFILIITFVVFGGTKLYQGYLKKEIGRIDGQIAKETSDFDSNVLTKIIDFQNKIDRVDSNYENKNNPNDDFSEVEKLMVEGVSLNMYEYDDKGDTLTLEAVANDFKTIAEQMLSFKKSENFNGVDITRTSRDSEGGIIFALEIKK